MEIQFKREKKMKKSLSLLFSVLFILVFAVGVSAQIAIPGYDVILRAEAPEIDGDLSDAVWAGGSPS